MLNKIYDKYFDFDPTISAVFLNKSQAGLRNFFIVGFIGYSFYAVLDYYNHYYIGVFLRILILLLCLIPITINLRKLPLSKMNFFSNVSLFLIFISEIETQLHATDLPFHEATIWFADIIIILIYSMYFLGNPIGYFIFWFVLISYYCIRTYLFSEGEISYPIINAWAYHIATYFFGGVFNYWWFKIRYESVIADLKVKEEYEKRISLEKELTKVRERDFIFADIHDNLGGKLLDLSIQLNSLPMDSFSNSYAKENIVNSINEILKGLRTRLLVFEDMNKIEENFEDGLKLFLVRRYSKANRKINIQFLGEMNQLNFDKERLSNLIHIISELVNNDLKYGLGISSWELQLDNNELSLTMNSESKWEVENHHFGNGSRTIRKRIEILKGNITEKLENKKYFCEIKI
ncbi:MAG: hypothetical protein KBA66_09585 [Leptospiraceae bacterium]|nr:hypothetical protein [Leptospiraceae bacterium]